MSTSAPTRVLAVCLGNICRSPMAEGLLRHHVQTKGLRIKVDSAGTNGYHNGEAPDSRAQAEMRRHGIEIAAQESRQIKKKDFEKYDLILVMDSSNFHDVTALAGDREEWRSKVKMFLAEGNVPDPYYGGADGSTTRERRRGRMDRISAIAPWPGKFNTSCHTLRAAPRRPQH